MATVEGYKAGVLVPTPTVKTRGLPQTTLNLNTHHQMGAHYGWDKLRQQTQKGLMGQVCYGSCSGRLGLGLVPTFKAWRTEAGREWTAPLPAYSGSITGMSSSYTEFQFSCL